ncbi:MAG: excinuclease ABC subunit UvrC [Candidatus Aminicenantaceae bacterium]
MATGVKKKISLLPKKPGIYFFKNRDNTIIYIGKARSLKERVNSYFQVTSDPKIQNILSETTDVDFVLTDSEKEAVFLENNFIQQFQPKYNLRLKDDKSFPYVKLTVQERFPGIQLTRKVEQDGAKYFGPFSPAFQARNTIHLINKYFGIRGCEEAIPGKRKRPCLEYDVHLCSAPCVDYVSEEEYREDVKNGLLFLEGKTEELLKILNRRMREAASKQEFEQATHWRDIIRTVENIKEKPTLISASMENKDIFGFFRDKENVAFYVFLMRSGKVIESEEFILQKKKDTPDEETLFQFLVKFYERRDEIPDTILLPLSSRKKEEFRKKLTSLTQKTFRIIAPLKGKNKKLVNLANKNAEFLLRKRQDLLSPLQEVKKILGLSSLPKRIEGFDISNTGGQESVGSLVVFKNGLPRKEDYRKYKIKTVMGPNDVASLKEVIHRRYSRALKDKEDLPDLILVDGGKGQLNAARVAIQKLGLVNLSIISLAKKEEIVYIHKKKEGLKLEKTSPALKLFQNIRDEAHRFAVTFHRQRRKKKSFESVLDGIPGIGNKRKHILLTKFKSVEGIKKASPEELVSIIGFKASKALIDKLAKNFL